MSSQSGPATTQTRTLALLVAVVAVLDQLSKAWAWRHVDRVTLDTGAGVAGLVLGDRLDRLAQDPLAGAVGNLAAAALLLVGMRVLLAQPRPRAVLLPAAAVLAGCASNLGDRLGLHALTAPGSARGVVNWIRLGGAGGPPVNLADVTIAAGVIGLGCALLGDRLQLHVPRGPARRLWAAGAVVLAGLCLGSAVNARDGVRQHRSRVLTVARSAPAPTVPAALRLGAPPVPVSEVPAQTVRRIELHGDRITVTWPAESVTVVGRTVLAWRADGMRALYLWAAVDGPVRLELFLPRDSSGPALCQWQQLAADRDRGSSWECNAGTPALRMTPAPQLWP